ncbi:MAG: hypothetical protein V8T36_03730 [Ruthenibacterium lactatiformans]
MAGTGSICFGRDAAGKTARSGGYGHKIDDEGSGYALGRDALAAVVRAQDGRGPRTLLTDLVFAQLKVVDVGGLVQFTYDPQTEKNRSRRWLRWLPGRMKPGTRPRKRWWKKHAASWRCWWSR